MVFLNRIEEADDRYSGALLWT